MMRWKFLKVTLTYSMIPCLCRLVLGWPFPQYSYQPALWQERYVIKDSMTQDQAQVQAQTHGQPHPHPLQSHHNIMSVRNPLAEPHINLPVNAMGSLAYTDEFRYPTDEEFFEIEQERQARERLGHQHYPLTVDSDHRGVKDRGTGAGGGEGLRQVQVNPQMTYPTRQEIPDQDAYHRRHNNYLGKAKEKATLLENLSSKRVVAADIKAHPEVIKTTTRPKDSAKASSSREWDDEYPEGVRPAPISGAGPGAGTGAGSGSRSEGNKRKDSQKLDASGSQPEESPKMKTRMPQDPRGYPLEISSQTMSSPEGHLTVVTEMLYDIDNNPFKPTNTPLLNQPYLPPTTDGLYPPTDDPRIMPQTANPFTTFGPTLGRSGEGLEPTAWGSTQHMLPTPPTPYRSSTPKLPHRSPTKGTTHEKNSRKYRGHSGSSNRSSEPKSSSSNNITSKQRDEGLGATAIAGIVIGSLVSVALLAGAALFVMYKAPFGKTRGRGHPRSQVPRPVNSSAYLDTSPPNIGASNVRVYRWPPRARCQNQPRN